MAKELPYFRLTCQEWQNGDISDENYSTQGIFVQVCCYYWIKNCSVLYQKLIKKFPKKAPKISVLIKNGIIKRDGDYIRINFLDKQLAELTEKHRKYSEYGKKGVEARERNKQATLKPPLSIKDKDKDKDKDNIKEIVKKKDAPDFSNARSEFLRSESFKAELKEYLQSRKSKPTPRAKELLLLKLHKYDLETAIAMIRQSIENGWTGIFELKNTNDKRGSNAKTFGQLQDEQLEATIEGIKSRARMGSPKDGRDRGGNIEPISIE